MTNAVIEGLKALLRNAFVAILPIILTGINTKTGEFMINWQVIFATAVVAIIMGIDKWVHKDETNKANGIIPF